MGMSQPRAKRLDVIGLGGGQKLPSRSPRMLYPATVERLVVFHRRSWAPAFAVTNGMSGICQWRVVSAPIRGGADPALPNSRAFVRESAIYYKRRQIPSI